MTADLVFHGGSIFTTTGRRTDPVAVADGRIVAIGADDVAATTGTSTEVVDLSGRLLVAGFQDAHVHPGEGGLVMLTCDLAPYDTEAEYLEKIATYAGEHPDHAWVVGACWQMAAFPGGLPRRETLDAVVPDRPAFFPNRDHHGAWVNSRALEVAGITKDTPDPSDGRIERDPDGTPTGVLHEGAMDLVADLLPKTTYDQQRAAMLAAQAYLHSVGITAWQDAILGDYSNITDFSTVYADLDRAGELTAKVVGALWWERSRGGEQIAELVERRERYSTDRFRPTSIKIMQDGVAENFTAGMTTPYLDACGHATDNSGLSMVEPEALKGYVTELDREGFQVHVHAIGDRAVREALDAFQAAREANGSNDRRHHIAHIQVIHPDDVPRFADLDVVGNMQPLWAAHEVQMDDLTIPFLGDERAAWQYPFGGLRRAGATLAGGSDWPVSSPDPLWGIHVAVNRILPPGESGGVDEPFYAEQALSVAEALTAYTAGSAYVNHLDDTGRIEVGAAADLAVLDQDILAGPAEAIGATRVDLTFVDGRLVHERT